MVIFKKPKGFDFSGTFKVMQRSEHDPINHWRNERWYRCLDFDGQHVIIEVYELNDNICVNVLSGGFPVEAIQQRVTYLLGFDDPLVTCKEDVPMKFVALPAYDGLFEGLVQTILGQLVSVNVANHVRCRFVRAFGESVTFSSHYYYIFPKPDVISEKSVKELCQIGINRTKAKAISVVAKCCKNPIWVANLMDINTPTTICAELLTSVHGIGDWTSDWCLLRALRRFDVVPAGDLVIRKALSWYWNKKTLISVKEIRENETLLEPYKGLMAYRIMFQYINEVEIPNNDKRKRKRKQQVETNSRSKKHRLDIGDRLTQLIMLAVGKECGYPLSEIAYMVKQKTTIVHAILQDLLAKQQLRKEIHLGKTYYFCSDLEFLSQLSHGEITKLKSSVRPPQKKKTDENTRYARTCYNHLAGKVGVLITQGLFSKKYVTTNGLTGHLTARGQKKFIELGLDENKSTLQLCLDWTERKHHVGGPFGKAMTNLFIRRGWIEPRAHDRSVFITPKGKKDFKRHFGVNFS